MSCPNILRALGIAGIALFVLTAFTPLPNILDRRTGISGQVEPAEAIVVLGAGLQARGVMSESSLRRALHGIILYRTGFAPLLVFSGPAGKGGFVEAEVRADMARLLGIAPTALLTEPSAQTTREEALRIAALLQPMGVHIILLVTGQEHMARSQRLFANAGFTVHPAPVDDLGRANTPGPRLRLMQRVLQEFLARLYYWLAGYL
jgi:uncharacterized SAM-binding protein YcdF (DUF218 family)